MGGCIENQTLPDHEQTDDKDQKVTDDTKEKTDVISPRTINVHPVQSQNDRRTLEPRSDMKEESDVTEARGRNVHARSLKVMHHTPSEHPSASHVKSQSETYGRGAQTRDSQTYDRKQASYRNEDPGTVDLKLQIQELRNERDSMSYINLDLMKNIKRLNSTLVQKDNEIDDLRTRLSRMASERLTDNNPNIADLSDRNRPTKIAERYNEAYTNEWSDAFDDLTASGKRTDQEAVAILLDFTKGIYQTCLDISMKNLNDLNTQILLFTGHVFKRDDMQLPPSLSGALKPFKDEKKLVYQAFLPSICAETNKLRDIKLVKERDKTKKVQKYLDTVTELCWLMCIQDPPVYLYACCKQGDAFDYNNFTAYTIRGKTVDYLVWPALHLHKDGQLLQKGVAEGKRTKEKETKQSIQRIQV